MSATQVSPPHAGTIPAAFYSNDVGPVATPRNPVLTLVLNALVPGYAIYWFYFQILPELKTHLRKSDEEVSPVKSLIFCILTLGIAGMFQLVKVARMISEGHQRAGRNVPSKGMMWLVCTFFFAPIVPFLVQSSLNDLWEGRA